MTPSFFLIYFHLAIANKISSYLSSDKKEEGEPEDEQNSEGKEETQTEGGSEEQEESKEGEESAEKQRVGNSILHLL